jgi:hypothetical protein
MAKQPQPAVVAPTKFSPTHKRLDTGELVMATRWRKDGDYSLVERYPIERREYKGLLVVGPKEKYALRFGDWVVEDEAGRIYVVDGQRLRDEKGGEHPSRFEEGYEEVQA